MYFKALYKESHSVSVNGNMIKYKYGNNSKLERKLI